MPSTGRCTRTRRAPGGSVVALVRSLAMRVSADPGVGERTLGGIVGACQPEEPVSVGVVDALVPV